MSLKLNNVKITDWEMSGDGTWIKSGYSTDNLKITQFTMISDSSLEPIIENGRLKGKVSTIGTEENGVFYGWSFICPKGVPGIEYVSENEIYYAGYSADELRAMIVASKNNAEILEKL